METIATLRKKFLEGTYTPSNAVEDTMQVITEKDGEIRAYIEVYDDAKEYAKKATEQYKQEGEKAPPLLGVPLAIKNVILTKGKRATAASKILENYVATYDATVIKRLKEAGAVLVGSTNLDEFAMGSSTENSAFFPTKNPLDTSRVPGGSSGGSAAAVAMGSVPAALGTDTGGSIRQPASFCGLVGFKPTYGAVSRYGLMAMGSSFDQAAPIAHTVEDTETIFNVIKGQDGYDATAISDDTYPTVSIKEKYRIGIPRDFLKEGVDPDVMEVFNAQIKKLTDAGHDVVDIQLPMFEKGLAAYYIAIPAEVSSNLARYDGMRYGLRVEGDDLLSEYLNSRAEGLGPEVKRRILIGTYVLSAGYYDAYYGKAEALRTMMRAELAEVYKNIDAVLIPTAPTPAFKIGEISDPVSVYAQDIFTVPINLAGVPAISIPGGTVERDGKALPVGVQYIAPHAGDARLFDIGKENVSTVVVSKWAAHMSPDQNDIVYEGYQIDFIYVGRVIADLFGVDAPSYESFLSFLNTLWSVFSVISLLISFILLVGVIYAYIRYNQMLELERAHYLTQERLYQELYNKTSTNSRWDDIQFHITTDNPNDWKLAVIEADVMLEETLEAAGYAGLTIGDKLKSASPGNFQSLDDAWRAHKVRNQIAHEGADFVLTKKAAQETITQYRRVFQEFGVI